MKSGCNLRRRASAYQFRFALPQRLASFLGRREIVVGLRTTAYRLAIKRARVLRTRVERLMEELDLVTVKAEAERLVRAWIDRQVAAVENNLASHGASYFDAEEAARLGPEFLQETQNLFYTVARINHEDDLRPAIAALLAGQMAEARPFLREAMKMACAEIGIAEEKLDGPAGPMIERAVLRGFLTLFDEKFAIEGGEVEPVPRYVAAPAQPTPQPAAAPAPAPEKPFFAAWDDFVESKTTLKEWKADMPNNARSARNTFEALVGDPQPTRITKAVVSDYKADLLRLPRYYDKSRQWRDLPLTKVGAAVVKFRDENPKETVPMLTPTTANKHLTNLSTYWNWLEQNGRLPEGLKNPFPGLKSKRRRGRAARDERQMWPETLERKLYESPVWTGCLSIHRRSRPGPNIYRDALFWVPLLGRLLGAREDELCCRKVGDIKFLDGLCYLEIRGSKTDSSDRDVPLPRRILDFGFLEYRFYGRAPEEPLFPELIAQGPANRHSDAFGGRFSHYRHKIGVKEPLVDFHSFRHNVTTDLKNTAGLNTGWIDEITGHASDERMSESTRYTKLIYLTNLKTAIDEVTIAANLSHLRYAGPKGVAAPGAQEDIVKFRKLAEQEMRKKEGRNEVTVKLKMKPKTKVKAKA
ncbi:DUF6538 domain-containing protein [Methylosinus sp. LW3]|uniref:DUF6538 domain-containing protein n=1 Tax=Methylosinus sp. LW3 TaxID=107635 RepID=UPI0004BB56C6|nr:DUF6538 domain-containing protein [Methylosinus sp. LW3]